MIGRREEDEMWEPKFKVNASTSRTNILLVGSKLRELPSKWLCTFYVKRNFMGYKPKKIKKVFKTFQDNPSLSLSLLFLNLTTTFDATKTDMDSSIDWVRIHLSIEDISIRNGKTSFDANHL